VISERQMALRIALVLAVFAGAMAAALLVRSGPTDPRAATPSAPMPSGRRPFPLPGEKDRYTLSMDGVAAGMLETSFATVTEEGRDYLQFQYTVVPTGALQVVWHYKLTGRTLMDPHTLRARSGRISSRSGDHDKITTVRFEAGSPTADVEVSKPYKDSVKHKQVPAADDLDVPAALVLLRTADWTAQPATFRVLNGDSLYQWQVSYVRSEPLKVAAGEFETDALLVTARELELQPGKGPAPKDKSQTVRVWLARDTGVPVRVTAELSLGTFQADLTGDGGNGR
jgi:hypothetical protein